MGKDKPGEKPGYLFYKMGKSVAIMCYVHLGV